MQLHKVAQGFVEAFSLKVTGGNPPQFEDAVRGTADLFDLYANDLLLTGQWNDSAGAASQTYASDATLPLLGRIRLRAISGILTLGANAGTWLRITVGLRINSQVFTPAPFVPLFTASVLNPQAAFTHYVGGYLSRPLIVPPGAALVTVSRSDATGTDHTPAISALYEDLSGARG